METATIHAPPGDFRALAVEIRDAGLLDRRFGYYVLKIGLTLAFFGAGWAALVIVGDSWATLGIAALLGVMFTQLGFVGHDAGHQQVFRSRRANWVLGLAVGNALIGLSFGWWVPKHSAHHAHPNQIDRDPDIGEGLVLSDSSRLMRFLTRSQGTLFFPLMLLQQAIFSIYLGLSFAPNHKGMPVLDTDTKMGFARRQIITARNISGGRFITFLLGGLNYQIEHHLFPTMPRPNLARAQSIVQPFCIASDYGYCEATLFGSYAQTFRHVRAVAAAALVPAGVTGG